MDGCSVIALYMVPANDRENVCANENEIEYSKVSSRVVLFTTAHDVR